LKIAIVGSGISGLTAAYLLSKKHDVTVFESADRIGGHTATIDVEWKGEQHCIDTGFIVFNDRTYPNFIRLLDQLGVASQESSMGFSVSDKTTGIEYAGNNLNTVFAQRKNIFSPSYLKMLKDILRFNAEAKNDLEQNRIDNDMTLGDYLTEKRYSSRFRDLYLIPMGAAIWSASCAQMLRFPLRFFLAFFSNHGLLTVKDKPQWRVIKGGSKAYLPSLTQPFSDQIRTATKIKNISREQDCVNIDFDLGERACFDHVVLACHSDQALSLLGDAGAAEKSILGDIHYQDNSVILHTDVRMLPKNRLTWSSWNYLIDQDKSALPKLTYNMNILQGLTSAYTFCVTLNADEDIDPESIIGRFSYAHPQFSVAAWHAQQKKADICGVNRTSFCGAYWANGFHEDGVVSAIDAVSRIDAQVAL
jgi:predicted NAD/FAD-binding protein